VRRVLFTLVFTSGDHREPCGCKLLMALEAPSGFEPEMEVLQAEADDPDKSR
jgi:hypothetical protein